MREIHSEVWSNVSYGEKSELYFTAVSGFVVEHSQINVGGWSVEAAVCFPRGALPSDSVRHDVVGCHSDDGGSCRDTRERTAGAGDVHVGIRQRRLRIHTVLRERNQLFTRVKITALLFSVRDDTLGWEAVSTLSSPEAMMRNAAGVWCPRGVPEDGRLLHCRMSSYSDLPLWNS